MNRNIQQRVVRNLSNEWVDDNINMTDAKGQLIDYAQFLKNL